MHPNAEAWHFLLLIGLTLLLLTTGLGVLWPKGVGTLAVSMQLETTNGHESTRIRRVKKPLFHSGEHSPFGEWVRPQGKAIPVVSSLVFIGVYSWLN